MVLIGTFNSFLTSQGKILMGPYLPRAGHQGSPYSEGGALYALGLIHANHGHEVRQFLLEALRGTSNEVIQHGACMGLGERAGGERCCRQSAYSMFSVCTPIHSRY